MDDYGKLINKQYKQLLEQCKIQMDRFERDYPELGRISNRSLRSGVSRGGISSSGPAS